MSEWLARFLSSGRAIDVVLAIVALEVLLIALWLRSKQRPLAFSELVGPVGAGVLLMLALRAALVGAAPELIVLFLAASFPAHLYDLKVRLARREG
ncbi:MAG: hypothetical protein Q8S33_23975 [Myxococcales bacterium]|nr:hypothetical protein [Myxococcales bacterium]